MLGEDGSEVADRSRPGGACGCASGGNLSQKARVTNKDDTTRELMTLPPVCHGWRSERVLTCAFSKKCVTMENIDWNDVASGIDFTSL